MILAAATVPAAWHGLFFGPRRVHHDIVDHLHPHSGVPIQPQFRRSPVSQSGHCVHSEVDLLAPARTALKKNAPVAFVSYFELEVFSLLFPKRSRSTAEICHERWARRAYRLSDIGGGRDTEQSGGATKRQQSRSPRTQGGTPSMPESPCPKPRLPSDYDHPTGAYPLLRV
jgi:hypothetical protein